MSGVVTLNTSYSTTNYIPIVQVYSDQNNGYTTVFLTRTVSSFKWRCIHQYGVGAQYCSFGY